MTRQLLTEALLLACLGTAAAVVLAWWGIRALPAVMPANLARSVFSVGLPDLDVRALAFGACVSILSGLLCGSASAARAFTSDAADGLLSGGQRIAGLTRTVRRMHAILQGLQVAMTVVLLTGAGLLLASVYRMATMPAGFESRDLGYASLNFDTTGWTGVAGSTPRRVFLDSLVARLKTMPGIADAAVGQPPVEGSRNTGFLPEGPVAGAPATIYTSSYVAGADYFRFAGMTLVAGRPFGGDDVAGGLPVAIVSEHTARTFWPDGEWIGRRFKRWGEPDEPFLTVVGVAPDVRTTALLEDVATVYFPIEQAYPPSSVLFRMSGDAASALASVRAAVRDLERRVTVTRAGSVDDLFAEYAPVGVARFYGGFIGVFAAIALATAMVGLYGTLSYAVSRRTREIGVRVALGAGASSVRWMITKGVVVSVMIGLVCGIVVSLWASRFIASQLFRVAPTDPLVLGTIVLLLLAATVVAVIVPVRRATRVDLAEALRAE